MSEHAWMKTRLGWVHVQANAAGITAVDFADKPLKGAGSGGPATTAALMAIERYLRGDLNALDALSIAPRGTPFQSSVWKELRRLRPGEVISYAELAARLGRPRALRPVGQANAMNPIALVVPCHRVVGSDGALGGYAWGGARKAWLLAHERVMALHPRRRPRELEAARAPMALPPLPLFEKVGDPTVQLAR